MSDIQTKIFRIEILKPINYTWSDFNTIINKANYASAQLANEVITKQYLLSKQYIEKDSSYCSMIESCKSIQVSSYVKCAICRQAQLKYKSLAKKLLRSDISIPTFKNNVLYIKPSGIKIKRLENGDYIVQLSILPGRGTNHPNVLLRTKGLKEKSAGYYQILQRIIDGGYKLGFCQLKKDKKRNKLYLLMSYTFEIENNDNLIETRIMGVDLGVATPAYCAFNDSVKRKSFYVEGRRLLKVKSQILARRRAMIREISKREVRRGHGLSGKYKPLIPLNQKWDNFRHTWNHTLSSRIVEYAFSEKAGTIHLEDLSVNGIPIFLGKEWAVAELLDMITYKANEVGIIVFRVDPYKTSQVCSRCGVIKENFTFKDRVKNGMPIYKCDACIFEDNADYNAAKNIAISTLKTEKRSAVRTGRSSKEQVVHR